MIEFNKTVSSSDGDGGVDLSGNGVSNGASHNRDSSNPNDFPVDPQGFFIKDDRRVDKYGTPLRSRQIDRIEADNKLKTERLRNLGMIETLTAVGEENRRQDAERMAIANGTSELEESVSGNGEVRIYSRKEMDYYFKAAYIFLSSFDENLGPTGRALEGSWIQTESWLDKTYEGHELAVKMPIYGAARRLLHIGIDIKASIRKGGGVLFVHAGAIRIKDHDEKRNLTRQDGKWEPRDRLPYAAMYDEEYFIPIRGNLFSIKKGSDLLYDILADPEIGYPPFSKLADPEERRLLKYLRTPDDS